MEISTGLAVIPRGHPLSRAAAQLMRDIRRGTAYLTETEIAISGIVLGIQLCASAPEWAIAGASLDRTPEELALRLDELRAWIRRHPIAETLEYEFPV